MKTSESPFGALLVTTFDNDADGNAKAYDASRFKGIAFRAKAKEPFILRVRVHDVETEKEQGQCASKSDDSNNSLKCNGFMGEVLVREEWRDFVFPFESLRIAEGDFHLPKGSSVSNYQQAGIPLRKFIDKNGNEQIATTGKKNTPLVDYSGRKVNPAELFSLRFDIKGKNGLPAYDFDLTLDDIRFVSSLEDGATSSVDFPELNRDGNCDFPAKRTVQVNTKNELVDAIEDATAGTKIEVTSDITGFSEKFQGSETRNGTAADPIIVCSPNGSSIRGGSSTILELVDFNYWIFSGLEITNGKKGINAHVSSNNQFLDLEIHDIEEEALHVQHNSNDNLIRGNHIYNTGTKQPQFGEGIYIGAAENNWDYSYKPAGSNKNERGDMPESDNNQVIGNVLGPNIRAEPIDVKEGTRSGLIKGNFFDGTGQAGENFADSWLDMKGGMYVVEDNVGTAPLANGIEVNQISTAGRSSGLLNKFRRNRDFGNPAKKISGDGISFDSDAHAASNQVECSNDFQNFTLVYTNGTRCKPQVN